MGHTTIKNQYNEVVFRYPPQKGFISVIIPVYMDAPGLSDTLASLSQQTAPREDFEILVANDGGDAEVQAVCERFEGVIHIPIRPNAGSYNARNTALRQSKGQYIAFTDADVIVPPDWLKTGKKLLHSYDYIGGPVEFPQSENPTLAERYEKEYAFKTIQFFNNDHFCVTANLFTKRSVFEQVGGFDIRLYSGGDNEFGSRVYHTSRFRQHYDERLSVTHPHRDFAGILKKDKRVMKGAADLKKLFPERYGSYRTFIIDEVLFALRPFGIPTQPVSFFFFVWLMRFIHLYHKCLVFRNFGLAKAWAREG